MNELRAEIESLEAERAELAARREARSRKESKLTEARELLLSLKAGLDISDPQKMRRIIEALVKEVRVLHAKRGVPRLEIRWRVD